MVEQIKVLNGSNDQKTNQLKEMEEKLQKSL
jgi:hypothetical protein